MKDFFRCVFTLSLTLNLEISRCHLRDYVKELYSSACRTCSTIIFLHSTNQIIFSFFFCCCRCPCPCPCHCPCLNSLIKEKRRRVAGARCGKAKSLDGISVLALKCSLFRAWNSCFVTERLLEEICWHCFIVCFQRVLITSWMSCKPVGRRLGRFWIRNLQNKDCQ